MCPNAPARRGVLRPLAALACAALLCLAGEARAETVILTGKVVTTVTRAVTVPFNSVVDEVLVHPGEAVEDGSPLLRYHLQDEAERILQREVTSGAGTEDLKSQVLDVEGQLAQATAERNKARQLVASGLGSKQALARLEGSVSALKDRIGLLQSTIRKAESKFGARLKELTG